MKEQKDRKKAYTLSIEGRVQGVGFRYSAIEAAKRYGVTGWVRNEPDGSVSAYCEGSADSADRFVNWCRTGPPMAYVTNVHVQEVPFRGRYSDFSAVV
ncbi:MAG: acylphosphatase [Spirochaetaceae bacterium]